MQGQHQFDHEKLEVYQLAIKFMDWLEPVMTAIPKSLSARDQIDRASTSIPLNIAEGNGRYTEKDRCRFFDTARGSALECAACLDVLVAKKTLTAEEVRAGKIMLARIVAMLVGLIKSTSSMRVYEQSPDWAIQSEPK